MGVLDFQSLLFLWNEMAALYKKYVPAPGIEPGPPG